MSSIRRKNFNKRWGLEDSETEIEKFNNFRVRVWNILKNIDTLVTESAIYDFCQEMNIELEWKNNRFDPYSARYSNNISEKLENTYNENDYFYTLEFILNLKFKQSDMQAKLASTIKEMAEISDTNVLLVIKGREVLLVPRGENLLDTDLVESPLSFLEGSASIHFIEALKSFQENTGISRIQSVDHLRRVIEEYFRNVFSNTAVLSTNRTRLDEILKEQKTDPQLKKIITQYLSYLDQYFNENSKHEDGEIDEAENEFLIYQVGLILRYINKLVN